MGQPSFPGASVRVGALLLLACAGACGSVPLDDDGTTPEPSLPPRAPPSRARATGPIEGPAAEDGAALSGWIQARLAAARSGRRERVRIPLVFRSAGWGCSCPAAFLGASADSHNGGDTWLSPAFARGVTAPEVSEDGLVLVVEGRFTGARVEEDLRSGPDDPPEYVYTLSVFDVERIVGPAGAEPPAVLLLGDE